MSNSTSVWNGTNWTYVLTTGGGTTPNGGIAINSTNIQPAADYPYNTFTSTVSYTANATGGDSLGLVSYMQVMANGHSVSTTASEHTTAIYGNGYLSNDGNAAGNVGMVSGVMGASGNGGPATLTNAVDIYGHPDFNNGGGHVTNHYFLYQEASSAATNEYAAFFTAPIGIGTTTPTYNFHMNMGGGANINFSNAMMIDFSGNGSLFVTRTGMYLYPGYNPGAGGFGCTDLVVGFNGAPNATTSTSNFLYISACAGPPTGVPAVASLGRCAMTYDTATHKLWVHDGTTWRGIVLT